MCLILLAFQFRPEWPLLLLANRDEFFVRPSRPLQVWPEADAIVGGRDEVGGGSWLALARDGRWGAVTNVREAARPMSGIRSRGELITHYLTGRMTAAEFLHQLADSAGSFPGFNLLLGSRDEAWFFSNRTEGARALRPGLYGLSNAALDTPWPKLTRCKEGLRAALRQGRCSEQEFFSLLADRQPAADENLPDTGFGLEWERLLSPPFISSPTYGTRCSTFLSLAGEEARLVERTFPVPPAHSPALFFERRLQLSLCDTMFPPPA